MKKFIIIPIASVLAGCATLMNGNFQTLNVKTNPPGATCKIGPYTILSPGAVTVRRNDLLKEIVCEKEGFKPATVKLQDTESDWAYGNLIIGILPFLVDSVTSADNYFMPDSVMIPLVKTP